MIVSGSDGKYLMEKCKWPTLKLPDKNKIQDCVDKGATTVAKTNEKGILDTEFLGVLSQEATLMSQNEVNKGDTVLFSSLGNSEDYIPSAPSMEMEGEDLMDNISLQSKGSDMEDDNQGWKTSRPKKVRKVKKKQVIGATRNKCKDSKGWDSYHYQGN